MCILITGSAGFIGYHLADRLLQDKYTVLGIDYLPACRDLLLVKARLQRLQKYTNFCFQEVDIGDADKLALLFSQYPITRVIHLAGKTGIRGSRLYPNSYAEINILGWINVLENCRRFTIPKVILASSSSVYSNSRNYRLGKMNDRARPPVSMALPNRPKRHSPITIVFCMGWILLSCAYSRSMVLSIDRIWLYLSLRAICGGAIE
jgi:UDP-glucuronate 4-epimerase